VNGLKVNADAESLVWGINMMVDNPDTAGAFGKRRVRRVDRLEERNRFGNRHFKHVGYRLPLEHDLERHPDATLMELRERSGMKVSLVCIHHTLKKLGFTRKKSLYVRTNSAVPT
jgi:hypothetical protein